MNLHEMLLASKMSGKSTGNADLSDYYTKSQTNSLIASKVDKVTGKGLSTNDFTDEYKSKIDGTEQYVTEKVAEIVANSPEDFDTLKEISDWIESHEDSAAAMNSAIVDNTTAIAKKADKSTTYTKVETDNFIANKVDKITGKGLSTNDFTTELKTKLIGLENYDDTAIKSDIAKMSEQIALNRGALAYQRKNLLLNKCSNVTQNGVTATVNTDGSITFSGSNTANKDFVMYWNLQTGNSDQLKDNKKFLSNGTYILSGGKNGVYLQIVTSADNVSVERIFLNKDGVETKFTINPSDNYVWGRVLIASTADFSSEAVTIYPMIRYAEITDDTYEPYKPSIEERLTALENAISGGI